MKPSAPSIEKDFGVKAIYDAADMSKPAEIAAMVAHAEKTFGSVDVLVNNAGIQFVSPIEDFPVEKWDQIIAINLSSAFHAIRAAIPGMKARKWGRIINTASAHSLVASPFKSAYVSAKHGIAGLTKTAALELATFGVTVNCISPGYVWTPLVEKQIPDTMKARNMTKEQVMNDVLLAAQPTKQFVTVEQVAALAVFLASDSAVADHRRQYFDGRRLDRRLSKDRHDRRRRKRSAARKWSIWRFRAAARMAPSPGACSTACWKTGACLRRPERHQRRRHERGQPRRGHAQGRRAGRARPTRAFLALGQPRRRASVR